MAKNTPHTHTHADGTVHTGDHSEASDMLIPSIELSLTLPWKKIEPVYNQVLSQMAKRVKSPGFRTGKVPPIVAKDIIGEDRLKEEVAKQLMPDAYEKLIKDSGKQPLTQPEFQAKKMDLGTDWEFAVLIAEKPSLDLKNYQKLAKDAKKEAETAQAEAEKAKKDDKKTPPAKPLTETEKKDQVLQAIFRKLILTFKPQVPELLLKQETRYELEEMVRSLKQLKLTLDDYLVRRQIDFDQLTNEVATQTLGKLQLDLIYSSIIEDQKITATDADVDKFLERITDPKLRDQQRKDERYLSYVKTVILREKVCEYLLSL